MGPNAYGLQSGKKQWTSNNTILIVFAILAIIVLANIPNWIKIHNYLNDEERSGNSTKKEGIDWNWNLWRSLPQNGTQNNKYKNCPLGKKKKKCPPEKKKKKKKKKK